jgi:hypothetical protein
VAGRFKVLTDEHWSRAHVKAAREAGWDVTRVVDVLGPETDDPEIIVPQRHRATPGRFVRMLERLASEATPFAGVVRFAKLEER